MAELTAKHRRFVTEYLKDQNATQAAIRAGYSKKTAEVQGCRLLRNVQIRAAVDKALQTAAERVGITNEYVLNGLKEVVQRCMQREPVMIFDRVNKEMVHKTIEVKDEKTGEFREEGVWEFDSMGANKALELLGKHLKLWTEKHEHTGKDGAPLTVTLVNYADAESPV